ncbi:DUF5703 domain-containing protein [Chryseolinea lacunae]|uniref:DUF5703 domain-containing protein n=1 Tax=Chryseolinea lacunae TaxID=2801331 RepID=A0ABS1L284_9BACT|nr:DUF5703 domain-containing protein [Chryseolinea lacunae]MBL0744651.1 hypothetical protein [Chryseolinea lacunae]
MRGFKILLALILLCHHQLLHSQSISKYNIIWDSQSKNSGESMPVGGHDVGCNVWVENGSVYLYFGRSNNFDENNALLKSGRIKLDFSPNPFHDVRQELKLENGLIDITGSNHELSASLRIWVEVDRPAIHIELTSNKPISGQAEYQYWRFEKKPVITRWVVPSFIDYPGNDIYWYADSVKNSQNKIIFYHQNNNDDLVIDKEIIQQDILHLKDSLWNPLKDFVFGGMMSGKNLITGKKGDGSYIGTHYKSSALVTKNPSTIFNLDILMHSGYYKSSKEWEKSATKIASAKTDTKSLFKTHQNFWKHFWEQSYIFINNDKANPSDSIWQVGRNYTIFRYQMACNAQGEYPTKFNGGLFTYDPALINNAFASDNPDFRAWGGGVMTAQNQRLLYWPLLKTGDFKTMPQQFDFYRRSLKNAELRTKDYWGHGGACFTDQMNQAGIVSGREFGWNRPKDYERGLQYTPYHEYYFTSQLEFSFMILEYYRYSGNDIGPYIPFIKSAIKFFDEHYRFRAKQNFGTEFSSDGKYIFYPCMALETYTGHVKNPSDVITALNVLTKRLQQLPLKYISSKEKEYYSAMASRLPEIPLRERNGHKTIAPAEQWDKIINMEIPQLYPVFPWSVYGLGKPNLQLAIDTWNYGVDNANQKDYISWHQDAIFCARMGLTDEAATITVKKLKNAGRRFPTFWGPGHDWVPDHNWGGSGSIGLQEMLIQTTDDRIFLFPSWPKAWDVSFKLMAPNNTIVEATYKNGKVEKLSVLPAERMKDVVLMNQ